MSSLPVTSPPRPDETVPDLEAFGAFLWYQRNLGEPLPPDGNWTYFANALMAATVYE